MHGACYCFMLIESQLAKRNGFESQGKATAMGDIVDASKGLKNVLESI